MKLKLFLCTGLLALSSIVQAGKIIPSKLSEIFPNLTVTEYLMLKEIYDDDLGKIANHLTEEIEDDSPLKKSTQSNDYQENIMDDKLSEEQNNAEAEESRKIYENTIGTKISLKKFIKIYNNNNRDINKITKDYIPTTIRNENAIRKYDQKKLTQENIKLDLYKKELFFEKMETQIKLLGNKDNIIIDCEDFPIKGPGTIIVPQEIISTKNTDGSLTESKFPKLFKFIMPTKPNGSNMAYYNLTLLFVTDDKGDIYPAINPCDIIDDDKTAKLLNESKKHFTQELDGQEILFQTTNCYIQDPETGKRFPFVTITTKKPEETNKLQNNLEDTPDDFNFDDIKGIDFNDYEKLD